MAKEDTTKEKPVSAPVAETTTEAATEATTEAATETTTEATKTDTIVEDINDRVIAIVKNRFSLMLPGAKKVTYAPGHIEMPRSHAEHWYSKAQGVMVAGVPDTGAINGVGAQFRLKTLVANVLANSVEATAFKDEHAGLTEEQIAAFNKASATLGAIANALGSL